jgi:hypothetical protein
MRLVVDDRAQVRMRFKQQAAIEPLPPPTSTSTPALEKSITCARPLGRALTPTDIAASNTAWTSGCWAR